MEIEGEIYATVNESCLKLGKLLDEARQICGHGWMAWIEERCPFGYDTAYRLRAVYLAYRELPPDVLDRLPRPWQALFSLRRLSPNELSAGVLNGRIHPGLTVKQTHELVRDRPVDGAGVGGVDVAGGAELHRHSVADLVAGKLLTHDPATLDPLVRAALEAWLAAADGEVAVGSPGDQPVLFETPQ